MSAFCQHSVTHMTDMIAATAKDVMNLITIVPQDIPVNHMGMSQCSHMTRNGF